MLLSTLLNGTPEVSVPGEIASDGAILFPSTLDQTLTWNGDGTLNYVEVSCANTAGTSYLGGTYRQTFTYSSGNMVTISRWVKQ